MTRACRSPALGVDPAGQMSSYIANSCRVFACPGWWRTADSTCAFVVGCCRPRAAGDEPAASPFRTGPLRTTRTRARGRPRGRPADVCGAVRCLRRWLQGHQRISRWAAARIDSWMSPDHLGLSSSWCPGPSGAGPTRLTGQHPSGPSAARAATSQRPLHTDAGADQPLCGGSGQGLLEAGGGRVVLEVAVTGDLLPSGAAVQADCFRLLGAGLQPQESVPGPGGQVLHVFQE